MSTTTHNIDASMYSLYTGDSTNNCIILSGIFNQNKITTPNEADLDKAARACEAIISGAKLCNIPLVAEISRAIEKVIRLLITESRLLDDDTYIVITNSVLIISNLNETPHDDLDDWYNNKTRAIKNNIQHLDNFLKSECITANNTEQEPDIEPPSPPGEIINELQLDESMLELFSIEAESQTQIINEKLLELENDPNNDNLLEPLMRASHSLKGAARMIGFDHVVEIAHGMEDGFVNCQKGTLSLDKESIDIMLYCNDILATISSTPSTDLPTWIATNNKAIKESVAALAEIAAGHSVDVSTLPKLNTNEDQHQNTTNNITADNAATDSSDGAIRIQSNRLNKIMGISNEILVSHNWVQGHLESLQHIKKRQTELALIMENLKHELEQVEIPDKHYSLLLDATQKAEKCRLNLIDQITATDEFDRRSYILSSKLNHEVIASKMRPFREGSHGFQRMVRDISHDLGKKIHLDLVGLDTLIDSDILEKIEAPLTHLIRNAMDHGIETPEVRLNNNKPESGNITVHAYHHSGSLIVSIVDDGKGVDLKILKQKIIAKNQITEDMADKLSESEILDFLFLPGFSTRDDITEYSGRGVGLDVVHSVVSELRGQIRCKSKLNQGMSIELQLPLTLSVMRTLLTEVAGEYYAFPLARINTVQKISPDDIFTIENKQHIKFNNQDISLIESAQVLGYNKQRNSESPLLNVIILSSPKDNFALVVDNIIGRQELALRKIDSRLGKIKDINAAAISDDGLPVLILDVDDMFISISELIHSNQLGGISNNITSNSQQTCKQILVIDDSLTVREVEKKLLESKGYEVDIAVDGADGWNTVRNKQYDLIISDIDMPRMNGIELVKLIKQDASLNSIPIMIVSYKDNPEDRKNGLEAGADYYLTKGSFHDESLIDAVIDLIGEAQE
ncbi:MAG: hybrid sensor histidine kinase/response regulator [Gammaproteobacteria bacterium]|nr:hybrid sensor histidine kinase/response regulator [Gammaproteobacteria bacterium]